MTTATYPTVSRGRLARAALLALLTLCLPAAASAQWATDAQGNVTSTNPGHGSAVLGQILSFLNVPQELAALVADLEVNRWVVFLIMNLLFLFLGFFIPPVAIILVTMPVLFPIITELGFDPVWFGVVMTLNMEMGLITPPVGLNLYVVQGIAPDIPLRDILVGSLPYVGVLALGIIILALFPGLVTWLPSQMLGG